MNPVEQLEQVQNELLCSICCDYFIRAITMSCSHSFCYNCISEWRNNNHNCPICREPIYSMAPSRALDNMVAALNVNSTRVRVENSERSPNIFETPTFPSMYPSTSSDSIIVNDDEFDVPSIESDNDNYVSDDNSYLSDDFRSYLFEQDSQEEIRGSSPEELDLNEIDDVNVSRDSSIFAVEDDTISVSLELNDALEYEESDNDSLYSLYSQPSAAGNVTIKHTLDFTNL